MLFEDFASYYSNSCASTTIYYIANNQSKEIYYIKEKILVVTYIIDLSQKATY